eukprot:scaffold1160_cov174-Ochromonas_danica.AAC.2
MISFPVLLGYLLVSLLWGCSNPFIKHAQVITSQRQAAAHKGGEDEADKGHTPDYNGNTTSSFIITANNVLFSFIKKRQEEQNQF